MIEYIEYKDSRVIVLLPKQLKQKKPSRLFRGNLVRGKPQTRMMFCIDIDLAQDYIDVARDEFLRTNIDNRPSWDKVDRLGPCEFGKDGYELLTSIVQQDTKFPFHFWDMFFQLNNSYVMLSVSGGGTLEEFETIARTIIKSLKIL